LEQKLGVKPPQKSGVVFEQVLSWHYQGEETVIKEKLIEIDGRLMRTGEFTAFEGGGW
jgi:hypothetical protein